MTFSKSSQAVSDLKKLKLKSLTLEQIEQIDEVLSSLDDYGEVHLIVQRGMLKYINKVESYRAWRDKEHDK